MNHYFFGIPKTMKMNAPHIRYGFSSNKWLKWVSFLAKFSFSFSRSASDTHLFTLYVYFAPNEKLLLPLIKSHSTCYYNLPRFAHQVIVQKLQLIVCKATYVYCEWQSAHCETQVSKSFFYLCSSFRLVPTGWGMQKSHMYAAHASRKRIIIIMRWARFLNGSREECVLCSLSDGSKRSKLV